MVNPKLIFYIRQELNDVPEEYLSDETIYSAILKAEAFVDQVVDQSISDNLKEKCVLYLATYYAYLNYISVVARGLRSVPELSEIRITELKEIALSFLRLVSQFDISDDFSIVVDGKPIVAFDTVGSL